MARKALTFVAVAFLFATGGVTSCRIFWNRTGWFELLPIPFAVIVILLILRTPRALLLVPLYVVVWNIAYFVAVIMVTPEWGPYPGLCAGGAVGGLGVWHAIGFVRPRLLPVNPLGACLVGCIAALPFGLWLTLTHASFSSTGFWINFSFATWQACVGTYLYSRCRAAESKTDAGAWTALLDPGARAKPPG